MVNPHKLGIVTLILILFSTLALAIPLLTFMNPYEDIYAYVDSNGTANINQLIINQTYTPASPADTCVEGSIRWDTDYIYVCISSGNIKRLNLSGW